MGAMQWEGGNQYKYGYTANGVVDENHIPFSLNNWIK